MDLGPLADIGVPGVVHGTPEPSEASESGAVLAIVPEPCSPNWPCFQPLNVAALQASLTKLISQCSVEIAKSVDDWASSTSAQPRDDSAKIKDLGQKDGSEALPKKVNQPVPIPPGDSLDEKRGKKRLSDPRISLKTLSLSSPYRRSVGSITRKLESGNSAADRSSASSGPKKRRTRQSVADTNVKALFLEERDKEIGARGMTGMLKLPSIDDGPLSAHKQNELEARQTFIQTMTRSRTYELVSAILILINAVLIAWESEVIGQRAQSDGFLNDKPDLFFLVMSYIFCCIFVLDLLVRSFAEHCRLFTSAERFWNVFDVFVVLTMVLEVISLSIQTYDDSLSSVISKFSMLRIVRLLRIVRVARIVKIVRFFRELRVLVFSILEAINSLMWSVLLMFLLFVMFGVFLNAGAMDYLDQTNSFKDESNVRLVDYFGTLIHTVKTLFQSISGGVDWGEPFEELQVLSLEYQWCFVAFITFSVFALLNVVTAVFVDGTIERTRKDRDFIMETEIQSKRDVIEQLYDLFKEIDEDGNGGITLDEFDKYLQDEAILTYFNALGLDIDTAWSLFLLLDTEETGIVNIEQFVLGCVRLKGASKKLDVAVLKLEVENICCNVKYLRNNIIDLKSFVSDEMTNLREKLRVSSISSSFELAHRDLIQPPALR